MKTPILVLTCVLLTGIRSSKAQVLSGPITNPVNGHDYYLLAETNWTAMEAEAVSLGGHLATIRDNDQNQWVWSTFMPLNGTNNLFIGLTDRDQEGVFAWVSGETSSYRNWRPGEPNNFNNEDYALIRAVDGLWNDVSGLSQFGVAEVPEPSASALMAISCGMGVAIICTERRQAVIRH